MTQKNEDCDCLHPLLPCLYTASPDELIRKQRNDEIDKQLIRDKIEFRKTHRLLLLGAGESGKSTIIKQMQIIHVEKFSEAVKQQKRSDIRNNLLDAVVSIVTAMPTIKPPVKLENEENQRSVNWILNHAFKDNFKFPQEFYDHVEILWRDKGVQATFLRSNEYQLSDSAPYFLEKISEIRKDNYMPSEQDILRCRVITNGIYELVFYIKNVKFQMIDVGGQRGERRKWFLCFHDVTAIIFVAECSSYDSVLREDTSKNRLRESLDIFKVVWKNRFLKTISVILFLNKQDIFREKILSGRSKIEDYFPEYKHFETPPKATHSNEHPEVVRAKFFIKSLFQKISNENDDVKTRKYHCCFYHFTCAVDTENIKRIFDDCRDSIQRKHLSESDLL